MHRPDSAPALLVIAHGSRDPRHAATVHALVARVRAMRPGLTVATGFLEFNLPSVTCALESLAAQGVREVVAQPLLLNRAYHAKSDIPTVLRRAPARLDVRQAAVLGPSPLLVTALERRLGEAGVRPGQRASTGVVLAAAGSTDPEAIEVTGALARQWQRDGWYAVRPAFAAGTGRRTDVPDTATAVRRLRAEGARRIAVARYVLAPGFLPDRIARGAAEAGAEVLAEVLGPAPEVAQVLLRRYDAACAPAVTALGA
ncbi:sirohydrochlorin chelatase [Streptomyces odontomachi]|uniref:sirohydrochlorin chelatase n=1 Tax=Streptomyces odontomachi TaxID=2944940 RepID=UPI00210DF0F5|nr:sirohydrochlorin chelatase [Streptomyces sp. ODS25]